jgi:hypothetical protein
VGTSGRLLGRPAPASRLLCCASIVCGVALGDAGSQHASQAAELGHLRPGAQWR